MVAIGAPADDVQAQVQLGPGLEPQRAPVVHTSGPVNDRLSSKRTGRAPSTKRAVYGE